MRAARRDSRQRAAHAEHTEHAEHNAARAEHTEHAEHAEHAEPADSTPSAARLPPLKLTSAPRRAFALTVGSTRQSLKGASHSVVAWEEGDTDTASVQCAEKARGCAVLPPRRCCRCRSQVPQPNASAKCRSQMPKPNAGSNLNASHTCARARCSTPSSAATAATVHLGAGRDQQRQDDASDERDQAVRLLLPARLWCSRSLHRRGMRGVVHMVCFAYM